MGVLAEPEPDGWHPRAVRRRPDPALPQHRLRPAPPRRPPPAGDLAELGRERIAVEKVSIPVFTLRQRGHEVYVVDDSEAVVAALAEDRAVYGYLWAPIAAWLLGDRRDVIVAGEFLPADVWDFGVALRAGDLELRAAWRPLSTDRSMTAPWPACSPATASPTTAGAVRTSPRG
jgi:ABC-type amino acid transport substrate-binding protein